MSVTRDNFCAEHGWSPQRQYDHLLSCLKSTPRLVAQGVAAAQMLADKFGGDRAKLLVDIRTALNKATKESHDVIPGTDLQLGGLA